MSVVLMRGLPGSGKSSWIQAQPGLKFICSADNYRMRHGTYVYKKEEDQAAHGECLKSYAQFLQVGCPDTLYVDNTNTTIIELAPYVKLAEAYNVPYKIVYLYCDLVFAYKRNIHSVPMATMIQMQQNLMMERLPSFWKQVIA